jgi:hypothetical protein
VLASFAPATIAAAAPPSNLIVSENAGIVSATWTLPAGWYTDFLEFSPTPDVGVDGFFLTPAATFFPIGGPATTFTSEPKRFSPGTYYVHVSAYDPACDPTVYQCAIEFSSPPTLLEVRSEPAPLPSAPPASPPSPPASSPPDTVTSFAALKCPSRQKVGRLVVLASMPEDGSITVSGTVSIPNAGKVFKIKSVSVKAVAGQLVTVKIKLSKRALKAARKARRRHRTIKANLTITARDMAGNPKVERRSVKLR